MNEPKPTACCAKCSAPATVFLSLVVGEQTTSTAFCAKCAPAGLLTAPLPATLAGLKLAVPVPAGRGRCPSCGFRWADFDRTQRLGCAQCYISHPRETDALIARAQPGLQHVGRRPPAPGSTPLQTTLLPELEAARPRKAPAKELTLEQLQSDLKAAVEREDYEKAARLRDQIAARSASTK